MAMDLDELDVIDDDEEIESPELEQEEEQLTIDDIPEDEDTDDGSQQDDDDYDDYNENHTEDAVSEFLKSKGISDSSKIKFANEDGEIDEVAWDDLSEDEKLNILNTDVNTTDEDDDTELDDSEIDLINRMRLSGMSVNEFVNSLRQQGANAYAQLIQDQIPQPEYNYTVDDLTDDELYVLDLQARVDDISEEELQEALDRAKSNETLFEKEVAGLREDYKRLEDERNERDAAILQLQALEQFLQFASNIIGGINNFTNIGELDVDMTDDDKNLLYLFITGVDNTGVNYFARALSDPDTAVKTAWFALHGEDIINSISDYYKNQIQNVADYNYNLGLQNAERNNYQPDRKVVIRKQSKVRKGNNIGKSIDDLDDID